MLCEIDSVFNSLPVTWFILSLIGLVVIMAGSSFLFATFYVNPTYEQWRYKTNPVFPPPAVVKQEITFMIKGLIFSTICPALSLYLANHGYTQSYCGSGGYSFAYNLFTFFLVWIGSDFYEFYYHRLGHSTKFFWAQHKTHHKFYNPTPFAVIADDYLDQFARSMPLLLFPLLIPVNIDMVFFTYALFFYGYGLYLHWGYEFAFVDAHNPYLNTAFQHYIHHAKSIVFKPYHTGFFFKIWDQMFGSMYTGTCLCVKCCQERGERSMAAFKALEKPDYSVLLQPSFWLTDQKKETAKVEASST
ncbi:hypothetical protein DFJ73DRAFT_402916 [Zopfochytrium polystomum]|nr:hypothetical protein DFJ73DRAFT_402916 [Zopfochytrium polystomum]